jgi:hypothetical protein
MPKRLQAGRSRNTVRIPQFACFIDSHRLAQFASWPPRARHIRAATPSTLLSFFCKNHDQKVIPIWAKHSMAVCSLPPSEAAPERVFALADSVLTRAKEFFGGYYASFRDATLQRPHLSDIGTGRSSNWVAMKESGRYLRRI